VTDRDAVSRIAQAVLYEGYLLWPYRRSAVKNRQRWTFGALLPEAWSAAHPDDLCLLQGQYLVESPPTPADVTATLRFLHVVRRRPRDAAGRWVDELEAGGERHLAWEEATERSVEVPIGGRAPLRIPAGRDEEPVAGGTIVRSWEGIEGWVESVLDPLEPGLSRLTVRVANTTPWKGEDRQAALRRALVSTHLALHAEGGAFVSLTDPPDALRAHAEACENTGTWPVLVGEAGDRSTMLSAPIILEDHPRIAPESPGDLFDGGEIDQLLILNVLALSESEQREMRDSDPRAREILERCRALGREELMSLHGRWGRG
jgi:hydrogenase maturation protease